MRALAKTAAEEGRIELLDVDRPTLGPDEALIEVAYAGVCGSDVKIYTFEDAYEFMEFPRIIGHEYSGTIIEVGQDVTEASVGDRVVEEPIRNCGDCYQCRTGIPNVCRNQTATGFHHDGAFTEYVAVPEDALHHVPESLSLREAAVLEPTSVAVRAVARNSRTRAGDRVLVEGPGPIGLLTAQMARRQGADVLVTGVDRDADYRLPVAKRLGFETANVSERDVRDLRTDFTGGLGFDVVFDATGHESGLQSAGVAVRNGGQVVIVGQSGHVSMDYTPFIRGEVDVQCSYASTWEDFEYSCRLLETGGIEVEPLLDDRFDLTDAGEIFRAAKDAKLCKPLLTLRGEDR